MENVHFSYWWSCVGISCWNWICLRAKSQNRVRFLSLVPVCVSTVLTYLKGYSSTIAHTGGWMTLRLYSKGFHASTC